MLRFFGQFFVKSEPKLDVLRVQIYLVNRYEASIIPSPSQGEVGIRCQVAYFCYL